MSNLSRKETWARQRTISQIHPHNSEEEFWASGKEYYHTHLGEYIEKTDRVLDFGCGVGRIAKHVKCDQLYLYDINESYLKQALKECSDAEVVDPFIGGRYFDVIYAVSVFIHMDWHTAEQTFKALAPYCDVMLLQLPIYDSPQEGKDWIDVTTFSEQQVKKWAMDVGFRCTLYKSPGKFSYDKVGQCHDWIQYFERNV